MKPTTPGWEERFDKNFTFLKSYWEGPSDKDWEEFKTFIREEITAAEERGYDKGLIHMSHSANPVEAYYKGQRDTLEKVKEMMKNLKEEAILHPLMDVLGVKKDFNGGYDSAMRDSLTSLEEITKTL